MAPPPIPEIEHEARPRWRFSDVAIAWFAGFVLANVVGVVLFPLDAADNLAWIVPAQNIGFILGVALVARRRTASLETDLGFEIHGRDGLFVVLGVVLQIAVVLVTLPLFRYLEIEDDPQQVTDMISDIRGSAAVYPAIIGLALLTPIGEELLFRGVLLRWLWQRTGRGASVAVSAAIFSVAHALGLDFSDRAGSVASVIVLFQLLVIGVVLAWLATRYRRLGPAIFTHAGVNLLAVLAIVFGDGAT